MKDRAGFFAGCADMLTWLCIYYAVTGVLIMSSRGWGLHLAWILLCGLVCAFVFAFLLKSERSVPLLTAVTGGLFAAVFAVFALASTTPLKFGYGFCLAVGSGMAVGLPLYYAINRPLIHKHLTCLDGLILTLIGVLLCAKALGIDTATIALMVIVLLMDAAAAVGLRMTEGGDGDSGSAFRAILVALGASLIVFLLISLLVSVFSRSGDVTTSVLHGIGAFFALLGGGIENFFRWLAKLFYKPQTYDEIALEDLSPSVANVGTETEGLSLAVNTTTVTVILILLAAALAVVVAVLLRRRKLSRTVNTAVKADISSVRRSGSSFSVLWQELLRRLSLRWRIFRKRNTPAGVLAYAERMGARRHTPRQTGETMRAFLRRMDSTGGLDALADALDREYYGGSGRGMEPSDCRTVKKYIRKVILHG